MEGPAGGAPQPTCTRAGLPRKPPSTRYQGSKLKLLSWIWDHVGDCPFHTALDAFGGTGSVAYLFKSHGKQVTYNDYLRFNHTIGQALIENPGQRLEERDVELVLNPRRGRRYDDFIARTFPGVYFTDEENRWLDVVAQNIPRLPGRYRRALAYYALFQACVIKRPYNLFHRKNLYLREADVQRGFGNKTAWDRPFEEHFRRFVREANAAAFDSGAPCRARCGGAADVPGKFDLVYIDPPYINGRGSGVDYHGFYHFLEGLVDYRNWPARVDYRRKHRPLQNRPSAWSDPRQCREAFASLFRRFERSTLVVSYRDDGTPTIDELAALLRAVKPRVECVYYGQYQYVLSRNAASKEVLLIAR